MTRSLDDQDDAPTKEGPPPEKPLAAPAVPTPEAPNPKPKGPDVSRFRLVNWALARPRVRWLFGLEPLNTTPTLRIEVAQTRTIEDPEAFLGKVAIEVARQYGANPLDVAAFLQDERAFPHAFNHWTKGIETGERPQQIETTTMRMARKVRESKQAQGEQVAAARKAQEEKREAFQSFIETHVIKGHAYALAAKAERAGVDTSDKQAFGRWLLEREDTKKPIPPSQELTSNPAIKITFYGEEEEPGTIEGCVIDSEYNYYYIVVHQELATITIYVPKQRT